MGRQIEQRTYINFAGVMNQIYLDSVRLLLDLAPKLFRHGLFGLKGGTAINLFCRDLPRLSVDLDLVYLDHTSSRSLALEVIRETLTKAQESFVRQGIEARFGGAVGEESKLWLQRSGTRVKVEVNHIFRGTLLETVQRPLVEEAQTLFFTDMILPLLATEELYGSKLVAAMDRQHPRDLFDVLGLYTSGGLSEEIVDCFVGYLAGHNRPVHEVLFANKLDLSDAFKNEFAGMTRNEISLDHLLEVRERLFRELPMALSERHRDFLLSLVSAEPEWDLMPFMHLRDMPAIRWKLQNLEKLRSANPEKFKEQSAQLKAAFEQRVDGFLKS